MNPRSRTLQSLMIAIAASLALAIGALACRGESVSGITAELDALIQPWSPATVIATPASVGIIVEWAGTGWDAFQYNVYRRTASEVSWAYLGDVKPSKNNKEDQTYLDETAVSGISYIYGVTVVGRIYTVSPPGPGPESPKRESPAVVAP